MGVLPGPGDSSTVEYSTVVYSSRSCVWGAFLLCALFNKSTVQYIAQYGSSWKSSTVQYFVSLYSTGTYSSTVTRLHVQRAFEAGAADPPVACHALRRRLRARG